MKESSSGTLFRAFFSPKYHCEILVKTMIKPLGYFSSSKWESLELVNNHTVYVSKRPITDASYIA